MLTAADARRRWFGALFLALASGMLVWGQTVLKSYLAGWWFLMYWLVCFMFTGLAMLVALLDIWVVRRRIRETQTNIWLNSMKETPPADRTQAPSASALPNNRPRRQTTESTKKESP